jgi:hypothetical protein
VEWFNLVDTQYRSDLRDLNEQNVARFDAKVEQRFAESDARFEKRFAEFETRIERRLGAFEAGIAQQFLAQTRFLYVSVVAQMALLVGLYLR